MVVVVLVLYALAVARLTRLINFDTIMDWLHNLVATRLGPGSWQAEFIQCPWCIGMWLAWATTWYPILITGISFWLYPIIALATSMVVGLMAPLSAERTAMEPLP